MKEIIDRYIKESIDELQKARLNLLTNSIKSIVIDNKYFDEKFMVNENITNATEDFIEIKKNAKPTLYWYELNSSENSLRIRGEYEKYREATKDKNNLIEDRNTSSFKKHPDYNSKTLYVGKVEKGFWGRIVTHLGYNTSKKTAGMQLFHWYKPTIYGNIKLNYIEFEPDMKHLIIILEKRLAKDLKPLIGRY